MKNGCREVMKNLCKQKINHPRFLQREKILTIFINKYDKDFSGCSVHSRYCTNDLNLSAIKLLGSIFSYGKFSVEI